MRVRLTAGLSADATRRTLIGTLYRYDEVGLTSAGPLAVGRTMPPPPIGLPLTMDHDRAVVRGSLALVDDNDERLRIACRVADGPLGDAALADAQERARASFSLDIEDAVVEDGVIVSGRWEAVGQVAEPAFNSARIDQIAASRTTGDTRIMLTDAQRARLDELQARTDLNDTETAELAALQVLDGAEPPAPADSPADAPADTPAAAATASRPVAASVPAVPTGVPARRPSTTSPRGGGALDRFVRTVVEAVSAGSSASAITAALTDVTDAQVGAVEAPAWSGELWSGLQYEPMFTPLLDSGDLTNWEGRGWRWTTKPSMEDYAGNKAAIPSGPLATEPGTYEAARMAVGHDIDRKFYDFPNEGFLRSYAEAAREDWAVKLDAKVEAYIIAQATASGVAPGAGGFLTRLGRLLRYVQRQRLGRTPFVLLSDNDFDRLLDITNDDLPAFMSLFNIDPNRIVPSANVPDDTAIAGAKQAAVVRTLPGSPIRVDAQHIANGGVDTAFFGYWAIEEHHTSGIVSMDLGYVA